MDQSCGSTGLSGDQRGIEKASSNVSRISFTRILERGHREDCSPAANRKRSLSHRRRDFSAAFGRNQNIIACPFALLIQDAKTPRKESSRHAPRAVRPLGIRSGSEDFQVEIEPRCVPRITPRPLVLDTLATGSVSEFPRIAK